MNAAIMAVIAMQSSVNINAQIMHSAATVSTGAGYREPIHKNSVWAYPVEAEPTVDQVAQIEAEKAAAFESALKYNTRDHWLNKVFKL
jgi:hypothetical protein